jgi:hypothetical protein
MTHVLPLWLETPLLNVLTLVLTAAGAWAIYRGVVNLRTEGSYRYIVGALLIALGVVSWLTMIAVVDLGHVAVGP